LNENVLKDCSRAKYLAVESYLKKKYNGARDGSMSAIAGSVKPRVPLRRIAFFLFPDT
jgi:hypothetical protein